ncbi:hypothetical protein PanWU01x14_152820, partial [Parasponia andersonii]
LKGKEVAEEVVATSSKSKKKTAATKKSKPFATPSVVFKESMGLKNLKADQVKQTERMKTIKNVQKEILDRLIAAFVDPIDAAIHPSRSSQLDIPISPLVATSPQKEAKKCYKKT